MNLAENIFKKQKYDTNRRLLPVDLKQVAYFFSRNKITSAITFKGKRFIIDRPLEWLEKKTVTRNFFRVSRQVLVNVAAVKNIHLLINGRLSLETVPIHDEKIIVSRGKAKSFLNWMNESDRGESKKRADVPAG